MYAMEITYLLWELLLYCIPIVTCARELLLHCIPMVTSAIRITFFVIIDVQFLKQFSLQVIILKERNTFTFFLVEK